MCKTLKCKVEATKDRRDAQNDNEIVASNVLLLEPAQQKNTHATDEIKFRELEEYCNTLKVRAQDSIATKMFSILKEIGVELSSYHGGSLNGKDIRKVKTNASYIFDSLAFFLRVGRGQTACCWMPTSMLCACNLERCLFCGTGHFH